MTLSLFWNLFDAYVAVANAIALLVALIIMLSSADDLFVDICYWTRRLYRALFVQTRYPRLTIAELRVPEEKWIAIMIPAWQEQNVLERMVETTLTNLEYEHYVVFVGVYPNDPPTAEALRRVTERYRQVVPVTVPHDGPTCKADCLNWIIAAVLEHEREHKRDYAGFVMHDSEDVVHPLELRMFNYLLPRKDFIQLPVLSLECDWHQWVSSTYMDDFAEHHQKELDIRERMTGFVPGAGVGSCYSRRAMMSVIEANPAEPFNTATLTEDYDFSFRMGRRGMKQVFVRMPVHFRVKRKTILGRTVEREAASYIATRAFFPDNFGAAYRQRARWIIGIAFQGWKAHGWRGSFWNKYFLWRDRKGVITALTASVAYAIVINYLLLWLAMLLFPVLRSHVSLPAGNLIAIIMAINLLFFANRVVHRFYFVGRLYGWGHGLLAIIRIIINNFINCAATGRAWRLFLSHLVTGTRIAWDKTAHHAYPTADQLMPFRRRLGEVLLEWNAIDREKLETALREQARTGRRLGRVLLGNGAITAQVLADAIAHMYRLPRGEVERATIAATIRWLPHRLIVRHRLVPLGTGDNGHLRVGVCNPLSDEARQALAAVSPLTVDQVIITETEMNWALRLASTGSVDEAGRTEAARPLLGDLLIQRGAVSVNELAKAMDDYDPDRDGPIGTYLVQRGVLSEQRLSEALHVQKQAA
jgi:adsorption protein B